MNNDNTYTCMITVSAGNLLMWCIVIINKTRELTS